MPAPDSTDRVAPDPDAALDLLRTADLVVLGRMPWSSNVTLLCELWPAGSRPDGGLDDERERIEPILDPDDAAGGTSPLGRTIYKPHRGERPLWDFPDGLYRREVGAYELAQAIGWDVIPPTVERDGPFGPGSAQLFIEADEDEHYFTFLEDDTLHGQLRRMAAFDLIANSTDRKGGHILADAHRHLWAIDNGLCLHAEFKLRTVIWDFADEPLDADLADDIGRFLDDDLPGYLQDVLDPFEVDALRTRARALLTTGRLPTDPSGRRFPWPLV
jgi:uncharacterized repeat protein (TIGR03843 family)